jgi:hypothetical protein
MKKSLTLLAVCVFSAGAIGQSFECYPDGPLPGDPAVSCEGVASNNLGGCCTPSGVTSAGSCGFPTNGLKYASLTCNGPVLVPNGGPFPFPIIGTSPCEVRVPIPAGSSNVTFDWEYFNAEGVGSSFNDGMAVAVLNQSGNVVAQLVYADNQVATGTCTNNNFATEVVPSGFQSFAGNLPALSGCEYLSIVAWNDGDNAVSGSAYIDNIVFGSAQPSCPVPCFGGTPTLTFSSPLGNGSVQADMSGLPGFGTYFLAVTLNAGAFPGGWFYGIDISMPDLVNEINAGFPFMGPVGPCGASTVGPFGGLPSGLTLYAVSLGVPPGGPAPTVVTNSFAHTIP